MALATIAVGTRLVDSLRRHDIVRVNDSSLPTANSSDHDQRNQIRRRSRARSGPGPRVLHEDARIFDPYGSTLQRQLALARAEDAQPRTVDGSGYSPRT